jgi:hypothetical protein
LEVGCGPFDPNTGEGIGCCYCDPPTEYIYNNTGLSRNMPCKRAYL